MSDFNKNLKQLEKTFQATKTKSNYLFYWFLASIGILWFSWIVSEWTMLNLWVGSGVIAMTIVIFHISIDMKYLEKRIENIESEIRDINEKSE